MLFFLYFLLIISVFLEGTITTLPLVLICLICLTIATRDSLIFLPAFFAGLFLDAFALRTIGGTSIFFLLTVFLILLYQRKYEINSYPFVLFSSFIGALVYLFIFGYQNSFFVSCVSAIIAVFLFMIIRYAGQKFSI